MRGDDAWEAGMDIGPEVTVAFILGFLMALVLATLVALLLVARLL